MASPPRAYICLMVSGGGDAVGKRQPVNQQHLPAQTDANDDAHQGHGEGPGGEQAATRGAGR